jgi:hypothetical protein
MANRPCKPDADMKRLWQTLLPGTPMPACGVSKDRIESLSDTPAQQTPDTATDSQRLRAALSVK